MISSIREKGMLPVLRSMQRSDQTSSTRGEERREERGER
jgi:hypothetical protein